MMVKPFKNYYQTHLVALRKIKQKKQYSANINIEKETKGRNELSSIQKDETTKEKRRRTRQKSETQLPRSQGVHLMTQDLPREPEEAQQALPTGTNSEGKIKGRSWKYLALVALALLLFLSVFFTLKLVKCLQYPKCGLNLEKHYLIVALFGALLVDAFLVYRIMLSLSSFWEKLSFNQNIKHPQPANPSPAVHLTIQSIALVSQYFHVERPQMELQSSTVAGNLNAIPSINLQLIEKDPSTEDCLLKKYQNSRIKKLSVCSVELGGEFLRKYGATDDWFMENGTSSCESVSTERSDYYLELQGSSCPHNGRSLPGSPASFHGHQSNNLVVQ